MGAIICRYRHASRRQLPTHLSAPDIATELSVSTSTVKTHMRNLYAKLGAHTRAEAVVSARARSLLAPVRIGAVGLAAQETPVRGTLTRSRLTIDPPSKPAALCAFSWPAHHSVTRPRSTKTLRPSYL
jgi:hypothetical protein